MSMVGHSVNVQGFVWVDEIQFAPPKKPDDTIPPKKWPTHLMVSTMATHFVLRLDSATIRMLGIRRSPRPIARGDDVPLQEAVLAQTSTPNAPNFG